MRVGIVGDVHIPFEHPRYLEFCLDTFRAWKVDHIHLIGDVVDAAAMSFWDHDPNGHSAEDEAMMAIAKIKEWKRKIRCATVSVGNHDARHYRTARKAGIPDRYMRDYAEVFDTPGWDWRETHVIDGVIYTHGTGTSGKDAAINRAMQNRCSCVMGHVHCYPGVKFHANEFDRIFGLNVGCGIDIDRLQFNYAKPFPIRPVLGCGVVIDGRDAYFEAMACGKKEFYYKGKRNGTRQTDSVVRIPRQWKR